MAFGKISHILTNKVVPICLRKKVFDSGIIRVLTYGIQTMVLTRKSAEKASHDKNITRSQFEGQNNNVKMELNRKERQKIV